MHDKRSKLNQPLHTAGHTLSLPSVAPIFPLNLEVIIANCLPTAGVTLLGYNQLTEAVQLGLQIIQR